MYLDGKADHYGPVDDADFILRGTVDRAGEELSILASVVDPRSDVAVQTATGRHACSWYGSGRPTDVFVRVEGTTAVPASLAQYPADKPTKKV